MQNLQTEDRSRIDPAGNGASHENGTHLESSARPAAMQRELTSEIDRLRYWHFWSGPALTLVIGAAVFAFERFVAPAGSASIVLVLPVLFAVFSGGLASGVVSFLIAATAVYLGHPQVSLAGPQGLQIFVELGVLTVVLLAGERLRRSSYRARLADKLNRQLRYEIHERGRVERELREQKESFQDFAENGSIGMHWVGPDGTILWVNQCELDMLGYTVEEYVGRNIAEFHADQEVITDILQRLTNDETLLDEPAVLVARDGSHRHVLINSNVRRDKGQFLHTRCFTRDVTRQHSAEQQLRREAQRFRSISEHLPVALYTTDESGVITFYNEKAADAWGQHPVVGEDLWCGSWRIFWPDGSECPLDECPMAISLKERRPVWGHEILIERPDGTRIWAQPYPTPLFDAQGEFIGGLNLIIDITDRKQTEEALKVAEHEEQRVSEELHQLSRISRVLAESETLEEASRDVLRTICELTDGVTASLWLRTNGSLRCVDTVALGGDFDEFMEVTRNMVFKTGSGLPGRVLSSGAPAWIYDVATDSNFPRRPYAQRAGLGSAFAFPLKSGDNINGVLEVFFAGKREYDEARLHSVAEAGTRMGIYIERQLAEDAMRDSEKRFRAIFEQAGVGVVQADVDGKILAANERYCEMVGYTKGELIGRKLIELTHPDDRGKYIYQLGLLWAGEIERLNIEKRNVCKDGRAIWINKTMSLVRDDDGEAKYTLAVVQDVTARTEAQQLIREQQDYLRAVLSNSPITLAAVDLEGTYRVFTGTAMEPLGTTPESRLGRTIYEAQYKDPEAIRCYERALAGQSLRIRKQEQGHVFELSFAPHRDPDGNIIGAIALANDVTEVARAEEELSESRARLEGIVSSAMDAIITIDESERITLFNSAAENMFGYDAAQVLGEPLHTLLPERFRTGHSQHIRRFAETGTTTRSMGGLTALAAQRQDGTEFPIEASISQVEVTGSRLFTVILRDVTARAEAERALRESEEKFRTLVQALPTAVYMTDKNGYLTMYNEHAAELWGRKPELGKDRYCGCQGALNPDGSVLDEKDWPILAALKSGRRVRGQEVVIERPDGSRRTILPYPEPILTSEGEVVGAVNLMVDITERKQAEAELLASQSRLRTTLENAPLILTEIASDGTIELIVGRGMSEAGADADDSIGQNVYVRNKDNPERVELFERALQGEEINYTLAQEGMAFNTFIGPRRSSDGEITGVIGVLTNITDLYEAQRELRERDRLLQLVTEKAPLIIAHLDRDGIYQQFLGEVLASDQVTADTRVGKSIRDVYEPGHPLRKVFEKALAGEQTESTVDLPGGRSFHVIGVPNRTAKGEVNDVVLLGIDMTPRLAIERELRRSEAFLSTVLDGAPLILTLIDPDGTIRLSMGSSLTHKGLPVQDLVGKSIYKLYGDDPQHVELFRRALSGESYRLPITLGDVTYQVSARPFRDESGEIAGVLSLALDITDLKDTEDMLREREHQLTAILDNTPLTLAMHDMEGRRTMIVGRLIQDLGIDPQPYIGVSVFEREGETPELVAAMREALDHGKSSSFETEALGRAFQVFVSPTKDADGTTTGAISAAIDITHRVEVERMLRERDERFQLMSDAAPVLIWTSGPDHGGTWFNKAWLDFTGRALEEELGNGWVAGVHPADLQGCLDICLGAFENRKPFQMIFRLRRCDGEYRQVLDSAVPMFSAAGEFMGFIGSCTDITDHGEIPSAIPVVSSEEPVEA